MTTKSKDSPSAQAGDVVCPIRHALSIVGGKWKMPILCMLASGEPLRYASIMRKLGDVTNMMLSRSLKDLEEAGMLHRQQYNEVPPRVEYSLTEKGKQIVPILVQFGIWGAESAQTELACGRNCTTCQATV